MNNLSSWVRQPTTINGIAAAIGSVLTAVSHYLTHDLTLSGLVGAGVYSATHLIMNDNTAKSVSAVATEATADVQSRNITALIQLALRASELLPSVVAAFRTLGTSPAAVAAAAPAPAAAPAVAPPA